MTSQCYFHVTPAVNLPSILSAGLEPRIGDRSVELGERLPAIYLFKTMQDVENALSNWLGDCFPEDEALALLSVYADDIVCELDKNSYEIAVTEHIPCSAIEVVSVDLDSDTSLLFSIEEPKNFYHGTNVKFDAFDLDFAVEGGFFFTKDVAYAAHFGDTVLKAFLSFRYPYIVDGDTLPVEHTMEDIENLICRAKQLKHDCVYIKNFRDIGFVQDTVVAFDVTGITIGERMLRSALFPSPKREDSVTQSLEM